MEKSSDLTSVFIHFLSSRIQSNFSCGIKLDFSRASRSAKTIAHSSHLSSASDFPIGIKRWELSGNEIDWFSVTLLCLDPVSSDSHSNKHSLPVLMSHLHANQLPHRDRDRDLDCNCNCNEKWNMKNIKNGNEMDQHKTQIDGPI